MKTDRNSKRAGAAMIAKAPTYFFNPCTNICSLGKTTARYIHLKYIKRFLIDERPKRCAPTLPFTRCYRNR